MAKNEELENMVLTQMATKLKDDPQLSIMAEGDEELTKNIVKSFCKARVDEPHKIRLHFSNYIGYGYDFQKETGEAETSREIYERAVEKTKKLAGISHVEQIIADGMEGERFGWYITRVP
jgi:hypothetical protein